MFPLQMVHSRMSVNFQDEWPWPILRLTNGIVTIIIISAVHATAGGWPPQLFDFELPSSIDCYQLPRCYLSISFWVSLSLIRFTSPGVYSDIMLAHLVLSILATSSAHCPLMHRTLSIISFTSVLDLTISFRILSLFVMFNNNLSMLRWATANFFSWCFVTAHVSAP